MNTPQEKHAFVFGLMELLCPFKPRYELTDEAEFDPHAEFHWYLAGRATGLYIDLLIIIGIIKLFGGF